MYINIFLYVLYKKVRFAYSIWLEILLLSLPTLETSYVPFFLMDPNILSLSLLLILPPFESRQANLKLK